MRDHDGAVAGGIKARCGREADSEKERAAGPAHGRESRHIFGGIIVIVGIVSMIF
jgi:hypothetical protein